MDSLFIVIKRRWFDLIATGEKKIEYRAAKPFWQKRLEGRTYDIIIFQAGYKSTAPRLEIQYLGWDLIDGYYNIRLGEIISPSTTL